MAGLAGLTQPSQPCCWVNPSQPTTHGDILSKQACVELTQHLLETSAELTQAQFPSGTGRRHQEGGSFCDWQSARSRLGQGRSPNAIFELQAFAGEGRLPISGCYCTASPYCNQHSQAGRDLRRPHSPISTQRARRRDSGADQGKDTG